MSQTPNVRLCQYRYDPLDRLASRSSNGQAGEHNFYLANRLATQLQGLVRRSWLQGAGQLLAQQRSEAGATHCTLIATDTQGSVLLGLGVLHRQACVYTAYGNRYPAVNPLHLPGFNREVPDPLTGHYLLGNGYRAFNPVLMRFNSPDSLSPFGKGGLNAYAYCSGDPVNWVDPSGYVFTIPNISKAIQNKLGLREPRVRLKPSPSLEETLINKEGAIWLSFAPVERYSGDSHIQSVLSGVQDLAKKSFPTLQDLAVNAAQTSKMKIVPGDVPQQLMDKLIVPSHARFRSGLVNYIRGGGAGSSAGAKAFMEGIDKVPDEWLGPGFRERLNTWYYDVVFLNRVRHLSRMDWRR